jgi:hypothetical protein
VTEKLRTPTPTDHSVQNLEESFNNHATEQSTPTDNSSVQKIEENFQDQISTGAIDKRIASTLATTGQQYIDGRIKMLIAQRIESKEVQDNIRDMTNHHMNTIVDIEVSLKEQQTHLSLQVQSLQEQIQEGFLLLAALQKTTNDLQDQHLHIKAQNAILLQEHAKDIEQASKKELKNTTEQLELQTT